MPETKEEISIRNKEFYQKNKEKIKENRIEYYQKNKEKIKEYNQTEEKKMSHKISTWKRSGLITDDYEAVYKQWLTSQTCEEPKCNKKYNVDNWKCMDHCHLTGLFRDIICNSCNTKRRTKKNSSGTTNIYKDRYGWRYEITINKKYHTKSSTDLEFLKNYKIEYEKKYLYNY